MLLKADVKKETKDLIKTHGAFAAGDTAATSAGNLPCKSLIHAIIPRYRDGDHNETILLSDALTRALQQADQKGYSSVSMYSPATCNYNWDKEKSTEVILNVLEEVSQKATNLKEISIVNKPLPIVTHLVSEITKKFS